MGYWPVLEAGEGHGTASGRDQACWHLDMDLWSPELGEVTSLLFTGICMVVTEDSYSGTQLRITSSGKPSLASHPAQMLRAYRRFILALPLCL